MVSGKPVDRLVLRRTSCAPARRVVRCHCAMVNFASP